MCHQSGVGVGLYEGTVATGGTVVHFISAVTTAMAMTTTVKLNFECTSPGFMLIFHLHVLGTVNLSYTQNLVLTICSTFICWFCI